MSNFVDELISKQPPEVQSAIRELESRGLSFCGHFGYQNAVAILCEMNAAFYSGELYEWMRRTFGIEAR